MKLIYMLYHYVSKIYCALFKLRIKKNTVIRLPIAIKNGANITIGKNSFIGKNSRLFSYSYNGKGGKIELGNNFNAQRNFSISSLGEGNIFIGNNVLIGSDVLIIDNDHVVNPESETMNNFCPYKFGTIKIGNNTWIAEKAVILRNVTIGDYCIIGAGSVVTKDIPSYSIAVGNPAKVIKKYNFEKHDWEKVKK